MAYFSLITANSYKMSGVSGKRYLFYKNKPVLVEDAEDILKFKCHTDLFYKCDENGNSINNASAEKNAKSFVTFKPHIANRDETIAEANKIAIDNKSAGVDVNALLEEVNKDADSKAINTKQVKSKKKDKNPLECQLCGFIAKNQEELKKHLDEHSEED